MIELSASVVNKYKLIHAYLKKEGIDFNKSDDYFYMPFSQLKELICNKYDIKGKLDWGSMQKAKLKSDDLSEYEHQKAVTKWCRENKIPVQSSGNGFSLDAQNNVNYIARLKASGLSIGYPDLDVFIGNGISLHIEMKREKGGVISEMQERWINWLNKNGYKAKVCYGYKDAIEYIKNECLKIGKNIL